MLNGWLRARGILIPWSMDDLPEVGVVERDVACGFLFQTDSNIATLGSFVTNPMASVIKRGRAVGFIVAELTQIAQELGYEKVYGFTERRSMLRMCSGQGYKRNGTNYLCVEREF